MAGDVVGEVGGRGLGLGWVLTLSFTQAMLH
jgi:hypothetical protein